MNRKRRYPAMNRKKRFPLTMKQPKITIQRIETTTKVTDRKPSLRFQMKCLRTLTCSIGIICHLCGTTQRYLSYETTSQVSITIPENILPPGISVCFNLNEIILESSLDPAERQIYSRARCSRYTSGESNTTICKYLMNNILLSDILSKKTIKANDFITKPKKYGMKLEIAMEYYSMRLKCFKLARFKDRKRELLSSDMDRSVDPCREVLEAVFNRSFRIGTRMAFGISIYESGKLKHFRDSNTLIRSTIAKEKNLFYLDYEEVTSHYLPAPFRSACENYEESKFESKSHCFEECYGRYNGNASGKDGFITTANYSILNYALKYYPEIDSIRDQKCNQMCHSDCITKHYYGSITEEYGYPVLDPTSLFDCCLLVPQQSLFSWPHSILILSLYFADPFLDCGSDSLYTFPLQI